MSFITNAITVGSAQYRRYEATAEIAAIQEEINREVFTYNNLKKHMKNDPYGNTQLDERHHSRMAYLEQRMKTAQANLAMQNEVQRQAESDYKTNMKMAMTFGGQG